MEMKHCFSTETNDALRGVPALSPKRTSFLDIHCPWPIIMESVRKTCLQSSTRLVGYCKEKKNRDILSPVLRSSYPS